MAGTVTSIESDAAFQTELNNSENKLVVVDFFATWCGPCRTIGPKVAEFAAKYNKAIFLKVDVDSCQNTAASYQITAMPTFVLLKARIEVGRLRGADANQLEEKIKTHYSEESESGDNLIKGQMNLTAMITSAGCECLNQADDHPLEHALTSKGGYLESDCDEQLIIAISFNQKVKIHSLLLCGPEDKGPKEVKIFINQPRTIDFDKAESMEPTQSLVVAPEELQENTPIALKYVKFQNVENINIFVKNNQAGGEVTQIDYLGFIGSPQQSTNMSDFKRIAGKKGESH